MGHFGEGEPAAADDEVFQDAQGMNHHLGDIFGLCRWDDIAILLQYGTGHLPHRCSATGLLAGARQHLEHSVHGPQMRRIVYFHI